jgi:hypothetical protein
MRKTEQNRASDPDNIYKPPNCKSTRTHRIKQSMEQVMLLQCNLFHQHILPNNCFPERNCFLSCLAYHCFSCLSTHILIHANIGEWKSRHWDTKITMIGMSIDLQWPAHATFTSWVVISSIWILYMKRRICHKNGSKSLWIKKYCCCSCW